MSEDNKVEKQEPLFNFDIDIKLREIEENTVIVLRVAKETTPERLYSAVQNFQSVLQGYSDLIESKQLSFIVMMEDDKIEVVSEKEMNALGWHKKGLIFTP